MKNRAKVSWTELTSPAIYFSATSKVLNMMVATAI